MKLKSFPLAKIRSAGKPKLRYSILGTSFISGVMVEAIRQSADGEVYCVCGRTASTLEAFAKEHDVAVTYSDYSAMLEDPKVDIVYIGLPTCVHAEWVVKCARAGKHILNEKSFAINALDTEEALKEVRMHKVFCMEAQMHRCHPLIPQLREIVLEKKPVGEVLSVNASFTANIIDLFNRQAGGSILDLGCYPMSLVRYLFGEPVSMTGSATIVPPAKPGESAFDSETTVTVVFRSGLQAVIHTSNKAAHHWEFNVVCEGGQVSLSDLWRREVDDEITITRAAAGEGAPDAEERIVCNPPHNFYTLQIDTVNQAVRSGAVEASSPAMTWQDSVDNMRALDMWRKAIGLRYEAFE